jgi:glycerophosphoryl diester phosphodiesterase
MLLFVGLVVLLGTLAAVASGQKSYADGAWRKSLDGDGSCWTDRSCDRVMTCAHGGEWNVTFPYDSMPAFQQAFLDGADAVKGGEIF